MSFTVQEFIVRAELDEATLEIWVAEGWLIPASDPASDRGGSVYLESDLARAQLIRDLTLDLGVNPEGVGVILHLVDQMHGLRAALAEYIAAGKADGR